jgi:hypothetical protein
MATGCALALFLAEGFVRLFDPHARDHVLPSGFFVMDRTLGWRMKPATTVNHQTQYFAATYTTNAWGYRDQPRTPSQAPRQRRLLVYGDSQAFGWGVPETLRFSNLLEQQHSMLEVWNLAVPGYGLDQQLLAYEHEAQGWAADAVVMFVSRGTLERDKWGKLYHKYKPRFVLSSPGTLQLIPVLRHETEWTALLYRAFSPWYLPYFVDRRLAMINERWDSGLRPAGTEESSRDRSLDGLTQALLKRAAQATEGRGHRLILLVTLSPLRREALQNFCVQHRIQAVALDFAEPREDLIHGPHDTHWNARAHRSIAEQFWKHWAADGDNAVIRR